MGWIQLRALGNGDFIDFDIIDQIVNNVDFLRAIIPDVWIRKPSGHILYADGDTDIRLRIQQGVQNVPSFKGSHIVTINLIKPHTGTADYPIQLTLQCQADIRATVASVNNKQFTVRLTPTSKAALRGVKIHWQATTQE